MKSSLLSVAVAVMLAIGAPVVMAETKYLRCTFLLERWKIDDLKDHPNCPSGERGLGKPWMIETYAFDINQGAWSSAAIEKNSCITGVEIFQAQLTVQQDKLIFSIPRISKTLIETLGPNEITVIDRRTLKTGSGNNCELVEKIKNKI